MRFARSRDFFQGLKYLSVLFTILHIAGFFSSLEAVMSTRTQQGAVAWVISLNTFPAVALPAYWILGRSKFNGYVNASQEDNSDLSHIVERVRKDKAFFRLIEADQYPGIQAGELLVKIPILNGNDTELLIDGEKTFA